MGKQVRSTGERIRQFIIANVEKHPNDIVAVTSAKFDCTPQAVHRHIARLSEERAILMTGTRRVPGYQLTPLDRKNWSYDLHKRLAEDVIWERDVLPLLQSLPKNVLSIWSYAFTEMVNNVIDHSKGKTLQVSLVRTAANTWIGVADDGIGIFKKIKDELELDDERHALFELSKGKLTTDPKNHTGQGIFFSSRMMDKFSIRAGGLIFDHQRGELDVLADEEQITKGTVVTMVLDNHTSRSTRKVFDEFSSTDGDYTFNRTIVPVRLGKMAAELVSRSQAKRVLARIDQFENVVFDFAEVETIGQAFADEIFRVYARQHPKVLLAWLHASAQVEEMISRARAEKLG
jgi:hypothetical protein